MIEQRILMTDLIDDPRFAAAAVADLLTVELRWCEIAIASAAASLALAAFILEDPALKDIGMQLGESVLAVNVNGTAEKSASEINRLNIKSVEQPAQRLIRKPRDLAQLFARVGHISPLT